MTPKDMLPAACKGMKVWAKKITGVDMTQRGGYSLLGQFIKMDYVIQKGDVVIASASRPGEKPMVRLLYTTETNPMPGGIVLTAEEIIEHAEEQEGSPFHAALSLEQRIWVKQNAYTACAFWLRVFHLVDDKAGEGKGPEGGYKKPFKPEVRAKKEGEEGTRSTPAQKPLCLNDVPTAELLAELKDRGFDFEVEEENIEVESLLQHFKMEPAE